MLSFVLNKVFNRIV